MAWVEHISHEVNASDSTFERIWAIVFPWIKISKLYEKLWNKKIQLTATNQTVLIEP